MKSRLHRTPDYYYYRGSRASGAVGLLSTMVLGVFLLGFGQIKLMIETWEEVTQAQAYEKPAIIEKEVVKEVKTAKVTAYSCGGLTTEAEIMMNCPSLKGGKPRTANGTEPIPNKTMACDKANMGKTFHIKGLGDYTCTDTGGAIKGAGRFDIYVENVLQAYNFGVQYIEYYEIIN